MTSRLVDSQQACGHSPEREGDPIVGHKTFADGLGFRHEPLHASEAEALIAAADAAKAKRATDMPTEQDAVRVMWSAHQRLKELGWRETCYGPTNQTVRLIEAGSSGIHLGSRWEPWPEKTWFLEDGNDSWPSMPVLFKAVEPPAPARQEPHASQAQHRPDEQNTTEGAAWLETVEEFKRPGDQEK